MSTTAGTQAAGAAGFCGWKRRVDALCDRFEDAWHDGEEPRIEEYLATCDLPPSQQMDLFCELLKLERELRQKRGEQPTASEYLKRFATHENTVKTVFGEQRLGLYELVGLIGEGGMGVVYRAYDPAMRRIVALKVIRATRLDDSAAQTRFRYEAQMAARLDHEHIVPVYEAGQEGSQLFYTMRYISGRNLKDAINKKPLENRRAAHYIEQVARAVDHAHGQMILHRDLKPSNILIDDSDRAYVTDFGLAKALDQTTQIGTMSTAPLGTLPYMAPEQARNPTRAVIESDVYSLGATLYEAITGRTPFQAESFVDLLQQVETEEPVAPRRINPSVDRDLETICLKCLEKEPQRRYSSALKLAEDLQRYRRNEPIQARPVRHLERLQKWTRRNPVAAALVSVTTLLLLAVCAIVLVARIARERTIERNSSELGYQMALDTMGKIAQFAERKLNDRPADLRELLAIVSSEYDDFLARRRSQPRFARQTATVLTQVARILSLFGTQADALTRHEQAREIRQSLVDLAPEDSTLRDELAAELAESWHDIGILRRALGKGPRAILEAYDKALQIRQDLAAREPANRSFQSDLARSYGYIGDTQRESGHREEAGQSYDAALQIRERLFQANRSDLAAKFQLARSYGNSGYLERELVGLDRTATRQDRLERARVWHGKALELQRELVDVDPAQAERQLKGDTKTVIMFRDFQADLAATHRALGVIRTEFGQHAEALDEYQQALKILDQLIKDHAGVTEFQGERAWVLSYRGSLRNSPAELDEAERVFRDLVRDNPNVIRFRAGAARNMAARGMLLLARAGASATDFDEGRQLLSTAREEQRSIVANDPENFDYQSDLRQTEAALNGSAPLKP
jgi:serine/threonine protein kinase/xanthine/CO dehydrogenase XdhC/CoxF family maturation factor